MEFKVLYFGGKGSLEKVRAFLAKLLTSGDVLGAYVEKKNDVVVGYCILARSYNNKVQNIINELKSLLTDPLFFVYDVSSPDDFYSHFQSLPQNLKHLAWMLYVVCLSLQHFSNVVCLRFI